MFLRLSGLMVGGHEAKLAHVGPGHLAHVNRGHQSAFLKKIINLIFWLAQCQNLQEAKRKIPERKPRHFEEGSFS